MTEQEFQIALAAVRQQRETALDALMQNAVAITQLQARIVELEAQLAARPAPKATAVKSSR